MFGIFPDAFLWLTQQIFPFNDALGSRSKIGDVLTSFSMARYW